MLTNLHAVVGNASLSSEAEEFKDDKQAESDPPSNPQQQEDLARLYGYSEKPSKKRIGMKGSVWRHDAVGHEIEKKLTVFSRKPGAHLV